MLRYAVAFHGAASCGGAVTTVNPGYTGAEIAHQLRDSAADFLVTTSALLPKALEAASAGTRVQRVFLLDGDAAAAAAVAALPSAACAVQVTAFAELLAAGDGKFAAVAAAAAVGPDDVAAIPYSSGTSGLPKGVVLTHRNLVCQLQQLCAAHVKLSPADTLVGVLPFFHIYGLVVILNASLAAGAKTVTLPKFDPPLFLKVWTNNVELT